MKINLLTRIHFECSKVGLICAAHAQRTHTHTPTFSNTVMSLVQRFCSISTNVFQLCRWLVCLVLFLLLLRVCNVLIYWQIAGKTFLFVRFFNCNDTPKSYGVNMKYIKNFAQTCKQTNK